MRRSAPATRASNTRQRPSLDAVASSAPAGCHATATTLLPWQRRISLAVHQPLRASRYATLTQRAALPMANLRPHGLQRTHSAASSSRVTTCVPVRLASVTALELGSWGLSNQYARIYAAGPQTGCQATAQ